MRHMLCLASAAVLAFSGCKATPPGSIETHMMAIAKRNLLVGNKRQRNPLPATPETIAEGKQAFSYYCVACHGMDGQGTGVPFADRMSPPVPPLNSSDVQRYTDGQLKWVIDYGIRPSGMPASKGMLSDDDVWSIVIFLRHLPPAGSQGAPDIYNH